MSSQWTLAHPWAQLKAIARSSTHAPIVQPVPSALWLPARTTLWVFMRGLPSSSRELSGWAQVMFDTISLLRSHWHYISVEVPFDTLSLLRSHSLQQVSVARERWSTATWWLEVICECSTSEVAGSQKGIVFICFVKTIETQGFRICFPVSPMRAFRIGLYIHA